MKNSCILQIFAQITACLGCGGPTKQLGSFPHKLCHKSGKKRSILFRPFASSHATQRVHSKGSGGTKWGLGHTLPLPMSDPTHHTQRLSLSAGACKYKYKYKYKYTHYTQRLSLTAGACPSSAGSGKRVFCYYEGKRPPSEVDPCPCTHLLYKNVHIDHNSRLRFTDRNIFLMQ